MEIKEEIIKIINKNICECNISTGDETFKSHGLTNNDVINIAYNIEKKLNLIIELDSKYMMIVDKNTNINDFIDYFCGKVIK